MAALRYKGINSLDLSLVARLVLENLVVRLLKGDPDEMLVTAHELADEFGIDRETVREAFDELYKERFMEHSLASWADAIQRADKALPTSVRLKALRVFVEPLFKDEQPKLGDEAEDDAEAQDTENDRELSGWDHVQVGDLAYKATVQAGGEKGYLLNIDLIGALLPGKGDDGSDLYDPFADNTPKVVDMEFGSREECWAWFDQWIAPAPFAPLLLSGPEYVGLVSISDSNATPELSGIDNGQWVMDLMLNNDKSCARGFNLTAFLVGDESEKYVESEVLGWAIPLVALGFDTEALSKSVREALAYALAQAVPAPSAPAPAPAAKRKKKVKEAVS